MIRTFYNKNIKIFDFLYDEEKEDIVKITTIYNDRFLPINMDEYEKTDVLLLRFKGWLSKRYSKNSNWYKKQNWTYGTINLSNEFIIKSYGLSLSDQYWIKPEFGKETWEDINFFHNEFKYQPFINNNLERKYDYSDVDVLYTPTITTGGEVDKAWTIDNDKRVLYKSSNTFLGLEPINEFIASKICDILDVNHANYEIKILSNLEKKTMVSCCETFINEDTELISAYNLMSKYLDKGEKISYDNYLKTLEDIGIKNAKLKVQKMILLDLIMSNTDRHLNNFGVIRDVNSLKIVVVAPIYYTGKSLATSFLSVKEDNGLMIFFGKENVHRSYILNYIKDIKLNEEQIKMLEDIPIVYEKLLNEYYQYTNLGYYKENLKGDLVELLNKNIEEVIEVLEKTA